MTRVRDPHGAVVDIAASLARRVVGDGTRGFSYVDAPPEPVAEVVQESEQAPDAPPEPASEVTEGGDVPVEPHRGSSRAEWAAWAGHLGIEVPQDAGRDAIRDIVEAALSGMEGD